MRSTSLQEFLNDLKLIAEYPESITEVAEEYGEILAKVGEEIIKELLTPEGFGHAIGEGLGFGVVFKGAKTALKGIEALEKTKVVKLPENAQLVKSITSRTAAPVTAVDFSINKAIPGGYLKKGKLPAVTDYVENILFSETKALKQAIKQSRLETNGWAYASQPEPLPGQIRSFSSNASGEVAAGSVAESIPLNDTEALNQAIKRSYLRPEERVIRTKPVSEAASLNAEELTSIGGIEANNVSVAQKRTAGNVRRAAQRAEASIEGETTVVSERMEAQAAVNASTKAEAVVVETRAAVESKGVIKNIAKPEEVASVQGSAVGVSSSTVEAGAEAVVKTKSLARVEAAASSTLVSRVSKTPSSKVAKSSGRTIRRTHHNSKPHDFRSFTTAQKGAYAELEAVKTLERAGYECYIPKYHGDHGIDIIAVKRFPDGSIKSIDVIVVEVKYNAKGRAMFGFTDKFRQLTKDWLDLQWKRMKGHFKDNPRAYAHLENPLNIFKQHKDKIRFKAAILDENGIMRWRDYGVYKKGE